LKFFHFNGYEDFSSQFIIIEKLLVLVITCGCGCVEQVNRDADGVTRRNKDKKLAGLFAAFKRSPGL